MFHKLTKVFSFNLNSLKLLTNVIFESFKTKKIVILIIIISQFLISLIDTFSVFTLFPIILLMQKKDLSNIDNPVIIYMNNVLDSFNIPNTISFFLILISILIIIKTILTILVDLYRHKNVLILVAEKRQSLINNLFNMSWTYFLQKKKGYYINLISEEASNIPVVINYAIGFFVTIISIFTYFTFSFLLAWDVTILSLLLGIIFFFVFTPFLSISRNTGSTQVDIKNKMINLISSFIIFFKQIKVSSKERFSKKKINDKLWWLYQVQKKQIFNSVKLKNLYEPTILLFCIIIFFCLSLKNFEFAKIVIFSIIFLRMIRLVSYLNKATNNFLMLYGSYEKFVSHIYEIKRFGLEKNNKIKVNFKNSIEFKKFNIVRENKEVIKNVNLVLRKGEINILTGRTGCGKTSILDAIVGIIDSNANSLLIDNKEINQLNHVHLRKQISYVTQDTFLFDGTLQENIAFGNTSVTKTKVISFLSKLKIGDFIFKLPKGLDTYIYSQGQKLSGGERQRVNIIRELIVPKKIILLDEFTSALDEKTSRSVISFLTNNYKKSLILCVTHQPEIFKKPYRLFLIKKSRLIEVK